MAINKRIETAAPSERRRIERGFSRLKKAGAD